VITRVKGRPIVVLCALVIGLASGDLALARGVTVPELIEMTRFGSSPATSEEDVISRRGSRVAFVTQKGNLKENTREFSLWVLTVDTRRTAPLQPVATFSTSTNRPAITQVAWASDEMLTFIAQEPNAIAQVYSLDIKSGELHQVTHASLPVSVYKATVGAQAVVYTTELEPPDLSRYAALGAHGFVVPGEASLSDIATGNWEGALVRTDTSRSLHIIRGAQETTVPLPDIYGDCNLNEHDGPYNLSLSPVGEVALVRCRPTTPPSDWYSYKNEEMVRILDRGSIFPWWIVVDLKSGDAHPLTGAPQINVKDPYVLPEWSADGAAVIVRDDLLPLVGADTAERDLRTRTRQSATVDVHTGAAVPLRQSSPPTPKHTNRSEVDVALEEDMNDPWKLVTFFANGKQKRVIFDPNPYLGTQSALARESLLSWQTKSGAQLEGGLYWPLDYRKGVRYPVVIQSHGFPEGKFAPEGYTTTGYAAQPLAATGFFVVQAYKCISACGGAGHRALSEGEQAQEAWESLIDRLDTLGLIDRTLIGLQGYSRSAFHELYFLTHSVYPVAAVVLADGVDFSYLQYMTSALAHPDIGRSYARANGGPPFGESLRSWLQLAPGFNLDRIHSPMQLTALRGGDSVIEEWEPFAGLRLQGKPVELVFIPDAAHDVVKPWERFTSQQGAVDWFRFWLQGYERTVPVVAAQESSGALAVQYARWHGLREQQAKGPVP
jgi:dipeptidyl aminopeptidase/acylaminoacyl peptidase